MAFIGTIKETRVWPFASMLACGCRVLLLVMGWCGTGAAARAEVRFDVFLGYDGLVPTMGWFPMACEVLNDGPTFVATIEFSSSMNTQSEVRRMDVELPTGTLKRFILPVHAPGIYSRNFNARLLDGRTVRGEVKNLAARNLDSWPVPLSAAIGHWIPELPEVKARSYGSGQKPMVARIQPALVPDNPIALSGLRTIYLNSERALELKPAQAQALLDWMMNGGNLVVSIKQVTHLNGLPWLKSILPCSIAGLTLNTNHARLQTWLAGDLDIRGVPMSFQAPRRSRPQQHAPPPLAEIPSDTFANPFGALPVDTAFESAPMEVATGNVMEGRVLVGTREDPLIVTAERGRGQVTLLHFSPELKPFLNWANRSFFWAKTVDMPPELLDSAGAYSRSYQSIDGVFGAMVDSRQVRKLPVGWLLLLLASYLVVIGPLDRYWLKRINRQMLTWITFPAYVALFSVLIYFIGYKLRAGETEWNEIHLVDVLSGHGKHRLHGLSYGSLYSPSNAKYLLGNKLPYAAFRSEYTTAEPGRGTILQVGDGFAAQVAVPVWTSQLFVSHWWRDNDPPLAGTVQETGDNQLTVDVANRLEMDFTEVWLVLDGRIQKLGAVAAGKSLPFKAERGGQSLKSFVESQASPFGDAIAARRNPLGGNAWNQIESHTNAAIAACFLSHAHDAHYLMPPGMDMTREMDRGNAILLAWTPGYTPIEPLNQFTPRRNHRETLWRMVVPVQRQ